MANMSAQLEATSLQNYNDLRRGNINLNQFNAVSNTLMSETKGVMAIAKVYAEQYDANVECAQNDTCSGYANWTNDMTQEMMDFQGVSTIVDPTGKISFVKTREDGTTETLDTSELFTLATMKQQKYDLKKGIEDAKEKGGFTYINDLGKTVKGYFINPTTGKINNEELDNASASMVAQDSNAYGILHDYIGGYDFERLPDNFFTDNPTGEAQKKALAKLQKENPNIIYVDSNGLPTISKEQRDEAQKYVRERLESVAITSQAEAEYRKEEQIDAAIELDEARATQLIASANALGEATEKTADVLADIITDKFTFEEGVTVAAAKSRLLQEFGALGFRNIVIEGNVIRLPNPISPDDPDAEIIIDLSNQPSETWVNIFKGRLRAIPGYSDYLLALASGTTAGGKGGKGGAGSNYNN